jgi:hypothetical protein
MPLRSEAHITEAIVLNPDPTHTPIRRDGGPRTSALNMAFIYQGLIKVVPAADCSVEEVDERGPITLIHDSEAHRAQWWAWTSKSPGWYTPDGEEPTVQVCSTLGDGQQAIALRVNSVPAAVGLRFTKTGGSNTQQRGRFDEPVSGETSWFISGWVRIVETHSERPPAPANAGLTVEELEARFQSITQAVAIHAESAEVKWCGDYEFEMGKLGVSESDYKRRIVDMRYRVKLRLTYQLSGEELAALTKERFGGEGHVVESSEAWISMVDTEVVCPSAQGPSSFLSKERLAEAGYPGVYRFSILEVHPLGRVEEEVQEQQEEEVSA